jgi:serine phosphatase RsbU (regulator of sigma subunit)
MDSLKNELKNTKNDSTKILIYNQLLEECNAEENFIYANQLINQSKLTIKNSKTYSLKKFANDYLLDGINNIYSYDLFKNDTAKKSTMLKQALEISLAINDTINIGNLYRSLASNYEENGDFPSAIRYINEGLAFSSKVNSLEIKAKMFSKLGAMYINQKDYQNALKYYKEGLVTMKKTNNKWGIANYNITVGTLFGKINQISNAEKHLNEAINSFDNKYDKVVALNNLALMYEGNNLYNDAIKTFIESKNMLESNYPVDSTFLAASFINIGRLYGKLKQFDNALLNQKNALKIALLIGEKSRIDFFLHDIANTYFLMGDYKNSKIYNDRIGLIDDVFIQYNDADVFYLESTRIDSAAGDWKNAFENHKLFTFYKDKNKTDELMKMEAKSFYKNRFEKETLIEKVKSTKEIEKQKILRNSFIGGFILVFVIAIGIFRNLQQNRKAKAIIENQKLIVEEKNREILDSIEYALRIQTAILPPQKIVKQYLENSFIIYKPKDIVAGDFYWMETINDLVLFAACDCTGHGVPGAMVSVVCHNALNRAVREFGLTTPAYILDKTAEIVLENFSKSEEEIQDGMDISICSLNIKTNTLEWAGANNSLILINNGQLIETKADKQCIGYNDNVKPFTNHQFKLQPDTNIYLFTDGFADQFGGQPERKLTKNRFRELLLSVQNLTIQQQAIELDNFITNYKQKIEQTDDILVIGVKV